MSEQIKIIHRKAGFFGDEKFSEFEKRANDFAKEHKAKVITYDHANVFHNSYFTIYYEA